MKTRKAIITCGVLFLTLAVVICSRRYSASRLDDVKRQYDAKQITTLTKLGFVGEVDAGYNVIGISVPFGELIETLPTPPTPRLSLEDSEVFAKLPALQIAILPKTGLTDESLGFLGQLRQIRKLSIAGNPITDAGMRHLSTLSKLDSLYLGSTGITDEALIRLQHLSELRVLDIAETAVTGEGLRALTKLPRLERLILSDSQITEGGLSELNSLPKLKHIYIDGLFAMSDERRAIIEESLSRYELHDARYGRGPEEVPIWANTSPPSFCLDGSSIGPIP
jgi:hypothetical protein